MQEVTAFCRRFDQLHFRGNFGYYSRLDKEVKLAEPDPLVVQFLEQHPFPLVNFNWSDWCMVLPNSVVELNHLDLFNRRDSQLPARFKDVILAATTHVAGLLNIPGKLQFPSISELEAVRFYGDRFPGIEYKKMGFDTRAAADLTAQLEAESAYIALRSGSSVETHLTRMGGRGKLTTCAKLAAVGDKAIVGRLILMTSQRDLKLNGITEQALTACYSNDEYPIAVGTSWWHGGSEKFLRRFSQYERFWCFDASKYDASLPGWLVRLAIEILRDQFVDGLSDKYDAYWEFIFNGLVKGKVFLDNGLVFQRDVGTTSGHNHNTLVQSICTLIVGYASVLSLFRDWHWEEVLKSLWFESMGDDQLGAGRGICKGLQLERIAGQARVIFGIDWFGDKSFMTERLVDEHVGDFQGVQFLGKYWRAIHELVDGNLFSGVVPYRPRDETLLRLLFPERHGAGTPIESYARACGHYMDAAGTKEVREWLDLYMDWLEPQLSENHFVWDKSFSRKYLGTIDPGHELPPGRRFNYYEWLSLVMFKKEYCGQLFVRDDLSLAVLDITSSSDAGD